MEVRKWITYWIDRFIDKVNSILSKMVSSSTYQCPICGKTSLDESDISTDLYNHIYNKGNK